MNFELAVYKVNQEQFIQNKQQIVQQLNKKPCATSKVLSKNNSNRERFNLLNKKLVAKTDFVDFSNSIKRNDLVQIQQQIGKSIERKTAL